MRGILIPLVLIISMMGCAVALDGQSTPGMQPGEARAEKLFEYGIGQPWVGGNQFSSDASSSKYTQYYTMTKDNNGKNKNNGKDQGSKKHIETPKKQEKLYTSPTTVYFSYQMQAVPYTQYKSYAPYTGGNTLWIQGTTSWTQYAQVPQGSSLSLLATSSAGGNGDLYEINPNGVLYTNSFDFFPGNSQIDFYADTIGQHILLFIIDGQVSNSIVINVVPYTAPQPTYYTSPNTSPYVSTYYMSTYQYSPGSQPYPEGTILPPESTPISTTGDSTATIVSQGMRGYQVFLDGTYIGTEGSGGDVLDGRFTFKVVGNRNHEVRVYDGQFNYPKTMFFERGGTKIINVEPGTAVYI